MYWFATLFAITALVTIGYKVYCQVHMQIIEKGETRPRFLGTNNSSVPVACVLAVKKHFSNSVGDKCEYGHLYFLFLLHNHFHFDDLLK